MTRAQNSSHILACTRCEYFSGHCMFAYFKREITQNGQRTCTVCIMEAVIYETLSLSANFSTTIIDSESYRVFLLIALIAVKKVEFRNSKFLYMCRKGNTGSATAHKSTCILKSELFVVSELGLA
jgi:hypothetical protein